MPLLKTYTLARQRDESFWWSPLFIVSSCFKLNRHTDSSMMPRSGKFDRIPWIHKFFKFRPFVWRISTCGQTGAQLPKLRSHRTEQATHNPIRVQLALNICHRISATKLPPSPFSAGLTRLKSEDVSYVSYNEAKKAERKSGMWKKVRKREGEGGAENKRKRNTNSSTKFCTLEIDARCPTGYFQPLLLSVEPTRGPECRYRTYFHGYSSSDPGEAISCSTPGKRRKKLITERQ